MNILKAYTRGFKTSLRNPKVIFLIYAVTLLLALSCAVPFLFSLKSALSGNMSGETLTKALNYTTITELINFNYWDISPMLYQLLWITLIFWGVKVFLTGGIIRTYNIEDFKVSTFFAGAGVNFFRFLLCDVIMIALQLVAFVLLFGLAYLIFSNIEVISETRLFWAYGITAFIFFCVAVLLMMISDYAKFYMEMVRSFRVIKAIWKATCFVFNHFVRTYFLYFLLLVVPILTLILYKLTFDKIGMATTFGIIAMFFIQQLFIILRIWFRMWCLASEFEMFADDFVQEKIIDIDIPNQQLETADIEQVKVEVSPYDNVDQVTVLVNDKDKDIVVEGPTDDEIIARDVEDNSNSHLAKKLVVNTTDSSSEADNDSVTVVSSDTESTSQIVYENGDTFTLKTTEPAEEEKKEDNREQVELKVVIPAEEITADTDNEPDPTLADGPGSDVSPDDANDPENQIEEEPEPPVVIDINDPEVVIDDAPEDEIDESDSEDTTPVEPESDVDEEILARFYDDESADNAVSEDSTVHPDDVELAEEDTAIGAAVPLDFEEEEEDSEPQTVTITTTTTTTTTTTATTTESTDAIDGDGNPLNPQPKQEPQVVKLNVEPDPALTEVVSEDTEEGIYTGEQHAEDAFAVNDGEDFDEFYDENSDEPAMG